MRMIGTEGARLLWE